jgi:L-ascorbate metabolism protein UlaG (beta-lactamase superfamily)
VQKTDHFDGEWFFNPSTGSGQGGGQGSGQRPAAVTKMLAEGRAKWPRRVEVTPRKPPALDGAAATVTFIGHSTFLIQTEAGNLMTDPQYSQAAGPFGALGPRRARQPGVRFEDLPPISTVLLSHNHYDHCDLPTLRRLARRFDPLLVTPLGNARLARSAGIRRVEELDWWDELAGAELTITATPARHFSARTPWDRNRALWSGFMLATRGIRLYFAGDTGYTPAFEDIRRRLAPIDLALLPIGAYEPRWFMSAVHMNPHEAVQAHLDLGATSSIGMHFGTFQLTAEAIDDPVQALAQAREALGVPAERFRALEFGESARVARARGAAAS